MIGMEIKAEVSWKHPCKFGRYVDDAQLINYTDLTYGTFSAKNYNIAVTKVTDDSSYQPIGEFLDKLHKWDGVIRIETLLLKCNVQRESVSVIEIWCEAFGKNKADLERFKSFEIAKTLKRIPCWVQEPKQKWNKLYGNARIFRKKVIERVENEISIDKNIPIIVKIVTAISSGLAYVA